MHTPKAGGTSFKNILEQQFGNKFYIDYKDKPINVSESERLRRLYYERKKLKFLKKYYLKIKDIKCVHGHFLPYKYTILEDTFDLTYITWLRDPLERLISHYQYWFRSYNSKKSAELHKTVVEQNWSFEKFALSEELQNVYSKFLYKFPVEKFEFIGITEFFDEDIDFFMKRFFDKKIENIPHKNKSSKKLEVSANLKSKIYRFHEKDFDIYNFALEKKHQRSRSIN